MLFVILSFLLSPSYKWAYILYKYANLVHTIRMGKLSWAGHVAGCQKKQRDFQVSPGERLNGKRRIVRQYL